MQLNTALNRFITIARLEGISFLLLLFIAMPLKYAADIPEAVKYTGWAHGILFILYFVSLLEVRTTENWSLKKTALAAAASVLPFGTFVFEKKML